MRPPRGQRYGSDKRRQPAETRAAGRCRDGLRAWPSWSVVAAKSLALARSFCWVLRWAAPSGHVQWPGGGSGADLSFALTLFLPQMRVLTLMWIALWAIAGFAVPLVLPPLPPKNPATDSLAVWLLCVGGGAFTGVMSYLSLPRRGAGGSHAKQRSPES
jgi:hypothetical protein